MVKRVRLLIVGALILCPRMAPAAEAKGPGDKFAEFCQEWMQKLAVRERDNRTRIRWETGPDGTHGEYVAYSQDHTCKMKESTDPTAVPVGRIAYRELRYRQSGRSEAEAVQSSPQLIEATEVIEIFRFSKGKWVY